MTARLQFILMIGCLLFGFVEVAPTLRRSQLNNRRTVSMESAMAELRRYGYIPSTNHDMASVATGRDAFSSGLIAFQGRYGLPLTGKLDQATKSLMATPRCAVKDVHTTSSDNTRFKRQTPGGLYVWAKTVLTWDIRSYTQDLDEARVDKIVAEAFKKWQDVAGICFDRLQGSTSSNRADIDILFASGLHNSVSLSNFTLDPEFDGPGGTLGHAYPPHPGTQGAPDILGDAHFDEDELWCDRGVQSCSAFHDQFFLDWPVLHELGHSLGLDHSNNRSAVMYPYYTDVQPNLDTDDINRIKSLYGVRDVRIKLGFHQTIVAKNSEDCKRL